MTDHIDDLIPVWLSGAISEADQSTLRDHVASCERCATKFKAAQREFADLAEAVRPVRPTDDLRTRILDDALAGERFFDLSDQVAAMIDVSRDRAVSLLAGIDDHRCWEAGPLPGIDLYHLDGGQAVADAIVGFIRMQPDTSFPDHEHVGAETVLVLQGGYRDSDGRVYRRGDTCVSKAGSSHEFTALDGPPLVYLVVAVHGVTVAGMAIGPDDPSL